MMSKWYWKNYLRPNFFDFAHDTVVTANRERGAKKKASIRIHKIHRFMFCNFFPFGNLAVSSCMKLLDACVFGA